MTILDDISQIKKIDKDNMAGHIGDLSVQLERAKKEADRMIKLPSDFKDIRQVVICGMGGSAIGGNIVKDVLSDVARIPIIISRDYGLPRWAGKDTLVIAVSYSGETEETISAFREAVARKAKVIAVSTGGKLASLARKEKTLFFKISYRSQPRAAMGYLAAPLVSIFEKLGIISEKDGDLSRAIGSLREFGERLSPEIPTSDNLAKCLAFSICDRVPVVIGSEILASVAQRWKKQFNENAKNFSFFEEFPEIDHNAVEGISFPGRVRDELAVLLLESDFNFPRTRKRLEALKDFLEKEKIEAIRVSAPGGDAWAQAFSLVLLGDWVSFYLAMLNGTNPTPLKNITRLKSHSK